MSRRPLVDLVEPGWAQALQPVADQIARMGDFLRAEIAAGRSYLPGGQNVLRAFTQPLDDVRVLDRRARTPTRPPATRSDCRFSVAPDVRPVPRSLQNIYRELVDDLGVAAAVHRRPDPVDRARRAAAQPGAHRGAGRAGSHRGKGWEEVTEQAIRALVARGPAAGRDPVGPRRADPHAACSAPRRACAARTRARCRRDRGFFGSRPFSRANDLLASRAPNPSTGGCPDRPLSVRPPKLVAVQRKRCGRRNSVHRVCRYSRQAAS